jgi:hypothetical protein
MPATVSGRTSRVDARIDLHLLSFQRRPHSPNFHKLDYPHSRCPINILQAVRLGLVPIVSGLGLPRELYEFADRPFFWWLGLARQGGLGIVLLECWDMLGHGKGAVGAAQLFMQSIEECRRVWMMRRMDRLKCRSNSDSEHFNSPWFIHHCSFIA